MSTLVLVYDWTTRRTPDCHPMGTAIGFAIEGLAR